MNGNVNRGNYRPPQRHRRRRDERRAVLIGVASVLFVAVVVFAVLVGIEIFKGNDAPPEQPGNEEIPNDAKIFETDELEVMSGDVHVGDLLLINEEHPYVFPKREIETVPVFNGRVVHGTSASGNPIYSYYTQNGVDKCARMDEAALKLFQLWADDFYKATGNSDLFVFDEDGYRSYDEQKAKQESNYLDYAAPGATEHHTGKVIDLYVYTGKVTGTIDDEGFAQTFKWIYDNAYKYGFVHRYPDSKVNITGVDYEPYHFRYVGYPHAYYMYKNGLCLEEYLNKVKTYTADAPLEFKGDDGGRYMVYYCPASDGEKTTLTVPAEYIYTVSGDNREGFIITVKVEKEK